MKTTILKGFFLTFAIALANPAWAISITLEPASQTAMPGDSVFLDLTISGLTAGGPDSLGAFDIDLSFDDVALDFIGGVFGDGLNDPFDPFTALVQSLTAGVGAINLAEVSLLITPLGDPAPLDAHQSSSFVLATLEFLVVDLAPGTFTVVDFGSFVLGDGFGDPLLADTTEAVIRNPSGIPEPFTLALLGIGAFGLVASRRLR